ncbi:uncharacterized protein N7459_003620 [Penicillium hispanicum]|uniref:uncharacterized protein n=1 Tax=Penicillium hispanicum TaxID=1080232 RepID=UPI002541188E|nr:uncharacterized protein N7459_003620 [Penicillium hispanicum]KAJ5587855.1 hypothetical protein N7459_003620 [Penicillium hispanicum]
MGDAPRPSDDQFNQVLQKSLRKWSSYLGVSNDDQPFPQQAIDLKSLVGQTPPFLGDSLTSSDKKVSYACEEKQSAQSKDSLVVNGRSTWRTSKGICDLQPRVLPKQLLLAVGRRLTVGLSEDAPFSDWPGVQGLLGYDKGNYLRSGDHECRISYTAQGMENSSQSHEHPLIQIDLGSNASEEEVVWWRAVLRSGDGWDATTKYNGHVYLSPWSVSLKDAELTLATNAFLGSKSEPPRSATAVKYLSRFCAHHRLYAQCSVALAGVLYIPSLRKREISLPFPEAVSQLEPKEPIDISSTLILDLLNDHSEALPQYMTMSANTWGLRSLLYSTFFDSTVECNLVSAWLNPAFAILDSISSSKRSLAVVLVNRQPRLGILWLGAILTDLAKSILRDIRAGMTALNLPASAWTRTTQTFLTSQMGDSPSESIHRDDECRLLFITACDGYERPPIWPWKPFGVTQICDTELPVRQHSQCGVHCLEYVSWEWLLKNDRSIQDFGKEIKSQPPDEKSHSVPSASTVLDDYNYDFFSQSLSEGATRGIFKWLRSTGYPRSERHIYQHSWIDLEDTDEEEADNAESDIEVQSGSKTRHVERWLDDIE